MSMIIFWRLLKLIGKLYFPLNAQNRLHWNNDCFINRTINYLKFWILMFVDTSHNICPYFKRSDYGNVFGHNLQQYFPAESEKEQDNHYFKTFGSDDLQHGNHWLPILHYIRMKLFIINTNFSGPYILSQDLSYKYNIL